jgi:hypothetical protein
VASRPRSTLCSNAEGLPIALVITPGQEHALTAHPALMEEVDDDPEQLLCDDSDSDSVRTDCRAARR